jgi:hypothetical protein
MVGRGCTGNYLKTKGNMVKTISIDQAYIDYKAGGVGVRVRRDACRSIILERGRWNEYGVPYALPVGARELEARKTGFSALGSNVVRVEESASGDTRHADLRDLITGRIAFEAVSVSA